MIVLTRCSLPATPRRGICSLQTAHPRKLIQEHVSREVLELRFDDGVDDGHAAVAGVDFGTLVDRIEQRPDRVLLYTADGEAAVERLHASGVRPESSLIRRATLEDVFLRLTGRTLVD